MDHRRLLLRLLDFPLLSHMHPLHTLKSCFFMITLQYHLLSGLSLSGPSKKIFVGNSLLPHVCYMPCLAVSPLFDHIVIFGGGGDDERYILQSAAVSSFLKPSTTCSLLGPNGFISTLF